MSPLLTIAREYVGLDIAVLVGNIWIEGTLIKVADDGQALRLERGLIIHFVDILSVRAIRVCSS